MWRGPAAQSAAMPQVLEMEAEASARRVSAWQCHPRETRGRYIGISFERKSQAEMGGVSVGRRRDSQCRTCAIHCVLPAPSRTSVDSDASTAVRSSCDPAARPYLLPASGWCADGVLGMLPVCTTRRKHTHMHTRTHTGQLPRGQGPASTHPPHTLLRTGSAVRPCLNQERQTLETHYSRSALRRARESSPDDDARTCPLLRCERGALGLSIVRLRPVPSSPAAESRYSARCALRDTCGNGLPEPSCPVACAWDPTEVRT